MGGLCSSSSSSTLLPTQSFVASATANDEGFVLFFRPQGTTNNEKISLHCLLGDKSKLRFFICMFVPEQQLKL